MLPTIVLSLCLCILFFLCMSYCLLSGSPSFFFLPPPFFTPSEPSFWPLYVSVPVFCPLRLFPCSEARVCNVLLMCHVSLVSRGDLSSQGDHSPFHDHGIIYQHIRL